jgi:8-oxo-dGTP pyrophosphatase MutT (NUDIX family)
MIVASTAGMSAVALCACDEAPGCCERKCDVFPESVLSYDTYGGVTIEVEKFFEIGQEYVDAETFECTLEKSLVQWKLQGTRGVWINIPTRYCHVVPVCAKFGFEFQYAKNGLLVMTQWLPEDSRSRLPHGPTHQVGIGAVILHPITHKMLVVQEKSGPAAVRKLWKMPTGLTDPGEDIVDAAIREAKEETGLDVEFDRIICMRQAHGGIFKQSDMFFVCLLHLSNKYKKQLEDGVEVPLVPQEEEIAEIKWMSMDEFASQDVWQGSPLYKEMNDAMMRVARSVMNESKNPNGNKCSDVLDGGQCGFVAKHLPVGFRHGSQTIYLSRL